MMPTLMLLIMTTTCGAGVNKFGVMMTIGFQSLDVQACKAVWGIGAEMVNGQGYHDGGDIF